MSEVKSHRDLIVWQRAMDMTVEVYRLAQRLPKSEQFGLFSQLTRAAGSVPANIAEGKARATTREYCHFLSIARASLMETDTWVSLAVRLKYIPEEDTRTALALIDETGRLINAIRTKLLPLIPLP